MARKRMRGKQPVDDKLVEDWKDAEESAQGENPNGGATQNWKPEQNAMSTDDAQQPTNLATLQCTGNGHDHPATSQPDQSWVANGAAMPKNQSEKSHRQAEAETLISDEECAKEEEQGKKTYSRHHNEQA